VSDLLLDEEQNRVIVTADVLDARAHTLYLDDSRRRSGVNRDRHRRALVHDTNDSLAINYEGDYPAGVLIIGLRVWSGPPHPAVTPAQQVDVGDRLYELGDEIERLKRQVADLESRIP